MSATPSNLAEAFMHERDRVRDLLQEYRKIPTGGFGAVMLEMALKRADDAMANGDIVAMLRSYAELRGCQ